MERLGIAVVNSTRGTSLHKQARSKRKGHAMTSEFVLTQRADRSSIWAINGTWTAGRYRVVECSENFFAVMLLARGEASLFLPPKKDARPKLEKPIGLDILEVDTT